MMDVCETPGRWKETLTDLIKPKACLCPKFVIPKESKAYSNLLRPF